MTAGVPRGPIAEATAGLVSWLAETTGAPVLTGPPMPTAGSAGLVLWPLELRPEQVTRGVGPREPFRFLVRHLVVAPAADLLDRVLVAAVTAGAPTVVLEPPAPQLWLALGLAPQLAVMLDVNASIVLPSPAEPLVRQPLRIDSRPLRPLRGRVVGPGDVPLVGVRVQLATTGAATSTDDRGQFSFAAVPADLRTQLRLRVKHQSLFVDLDLPSSEPVVIHCDTKEV